MEKYKVLKFFRWGDLKLNKDQIIIVTPHNPPGTNYAAHASMISIEHYPGKTQLVATVAVKSMVFLEKIKKY